VPLHLDGARLWESTAYLGHTVAEIAELAGTVYVSFYKGLGGLAGAALAGPEDLIAAARRWQRRLGGNLPTLAPYAVSARAGLRTMLPRMPEFHQRAVELAAALVDAGFRVVPDPPHANAFKVYAERDAVEVSTAVVEHAERTGDVLSPSWEPADVPGWSWAELTVTAATMGWTLDEAVQGLRGLLRQ
jgi:threonine aldolase